MGVGTGHFKIVRNSKKCSKIRILQCRTLLRKVIEIPSPCNI